MKGRFAGVLETIGNTPLVEIRKLNPNPGVRIFAKLESFNPGGSVKDRPSLYMIKRAEERGELTRDKVILEATSGNTGIGLALVAAAKGYRLCLTLPESASDERKKILKALGYPSYTDPQSRAQWIYNGTTFWSFDTPAQITEKMSYAKNKGLGGAFFWEFNGDDSQATLLKAISNGLK